jgi:methionine-rich copper-binding protein CopC
MDIARSPAPRTNDTGTRTTRIPGRRLPGFAAAIAAAAVTGVLMATPADAHTTLTSAVPAKGAKVPSPAQIKLTFAEPVKFPGVVVLDAKGGHHESGKAHAAGATVTEQVAGVLPAGVYTVGWRVVAEDGHPVTGDYKFTVVGGSSPSPAPASVTASSSAPAAAAPSSTPAAQRTGNTSGASWWWVGLGAVIIVGSAGGAELYRKRRATRT